MKLKIDEIVKHEKVYPRIKEKDGLLILKEDRKLIDEYREALESGVKFPPITVQKVKEKKEDKEIEFYVLIDGYHRKAACKEYNKIVEEAKDKIKEIEKIEKQEDKDNLIELSKCILIDELECNEYKPDKVFDLNNSDDLIELKIISIKRNITQGLRFDRETLKLQVREIYKLRPNSFKQKEIATEFDVTQATISNYVKDLKYEYELSRDALILKLHLLGWAGEEIGDVVGLTADMANKIIKNNFINFNKIISDYEKGKPIEKIAVENGFDIPLTYAVVLQEKSDQERLEKFSEKSSNEEEQPSTLKVYDNWNFSGRDKRLGIAEDSKGEKIKGVIPGQIPMNVIYYYTEPDDLVVDPMAGGGSAIDACLVMGRRCLAYDIKSRRPDIRELDTVKNLIEMPPKSGPGGGRYQADLVFVDPPYWSMKDDDYPEGSISSLSREEFYDSVQKFIVKLVEIIKPAGYLAFLIQNQTEKDLKEGEEQIPHILNVYDKIKELDTMELVRQISCPQSSQTFAPEDVNRAKDRDRIRRGLSPEEGKCYKEMFWIVTDENDNSKTVTLSPTIKRREEENYSQLGEVLVKIMDHEIKNDADVTRTCGRRRNLDAELIAYELIEPILSSLRKDQQYRIISKLKNLRQPIQGRGSL